MSKKDYDFSGWATVHGVKCSDGRIIHEDAFKENDGKVVPLVYNHDHSDSSNVMGHALLENRKKGVYAFCSFNDTDAGKRGKELVRHGDISALSIYANKLVQKGSDVTQGVIREVSLVLAGANPGAFIDNVISQSEASEESAYIYNGEEEIEILVHVEDDATTPKEPDPKPEIPPTQKPVEQETKPAVAEEIQHKEDEKETIQMIFDSFSEKQKNTLYAMLGQIFEKEESPKGKPAGEVQHKEGDQETLQSIFDSLNEKQKAVAYAIIAEAIDKENNKEGNEKPMKHNVFEEITGKDKDGKEVVLTHADLDDFVANSKKGNSMRDAWRDFTELKHGITNMDILFPDYKAVSGPKTVDENTAWVSVVMNSIKHVPFARIKSSYFDITGEEARALGYVKGDKKVEETIAAFKRTTDPQTIYKLQKFDRDDIIDIVDFDVITWIKAEMRAKLETEIARAVMFGDGRSSASAYKIDPLHIRPVVSDSSVYTIQVGVTSGSTAAEIAAALIDEVVLGQIDYKGSGNLKLFIRNDICTRMLLLKDTTGHRLYKSLADLALAMTVNTVVPVPASVMGSTYAVAVDLSDYNLGADKGGQVSLFDDFDINYNKMEYLIETRCSGALVTPYSAIVFAKAATGSSAN